MVRNFLIILLSSMVLIGCRKAVKDPEDILPNVETTDAFVDTDGLFTITGKINSSGTTELYYLGGCYNYEGNPDMLDNQQFYTTQEGDNFTIKYTDLPVTSPVYCRVWATNEDTYSYGGVIKVDNVVAPAVTSPCSPTANTIDMGDGYGEFNMYTVTSPSGGNCYAEAQNSRALEFEFAGTPTTKIYTTTSGTPASNEVRITVSVNSITEYALAGYSVYVNKTDTNQWHIQLCDVGWIPFSTTINITADINYPF